VNVAATAQNTQSANNQIEKNSNTLVKTEGTYQIQIINSRNKPNIPANIDELVIKNRQANEIKYLSLGTEVRLMILPLSTINSVNFKSIERFAYIRE
jgi:PIN domain nuclease of toxin-antitoxin system